MGAPFAERGGAASRSQGVGGLGEKWGWPHGGHSDPSTCHFRMIHYPSFFFQAFIPQLQSREIWPVPRTCHVTLATYSL